MAVKRLVFRDMFYGFRMLVLVVADSLGPPVPLDSPVVADALVVLDTSCPLSLEFIFSYYHYDFFFCFLIISHKNTPTHGLLHILLNGKLGSRRNPNVS